MTDMDIFGAPVMDEFLKGFAAGLFDCDCVAVGDDYEEARHAFPMYEDTALARLTTQVVANKKLRYFLDAFVPMVADMAKRARGDLFDAGWNFAFDAWSDSPAFDGWTDDAEDYNKIERSLDYFEWFNRYEFWAEPDANGVLMPRFDFH